MRYQIMCDKQDGDRPGFHQFFETDDFDDAREFAMRLSFVGNYVVYVYDSKVGDRVRDFDDPKYRL